MDKIYDLVIIGAGPGGMTASIYAKRAGLDVVIIEKTMPGGVLSMTSEISNFTGFSKISGMDLATKMYEHTQTLDIPFIWDEVKNVKLKDEVKIIECFGQTLCAYSVILSFGASVRKLNLEREREFIGKGLSYCATCDGALYKGEDVALVGGGNTALEDALYLSNIAKKVYLIHRRSQFKGEQILVDEVKAKDNIVLVLDSVVTKFLGENKIAGVEVENKTNGTKQILNIGGLFVCIGRGPDTEIIEENLVTDDAGYIVTDNNMQTNLEGVFAVGDIRNTPLRQVITACSDGAIAGTKAFEYVRKLKAKINK